MKERDAVSRKSDRRRNEIIQWQTKRAEAYDFNKTLFAENVRHTAFIVKVDEAFKE